MNFKSKLKFIWSHTKRHLRFFTTVFFVLLLGLIMLFNWRLYHSPEIRVIENDTVNYDALCQLRYLRDAMEKNAANESIALRNSVEALALPIKTDGRKKYLLGKLPIADVFITWAQGSEVKGSLKKNTGNGWRGKFQVLSGVMAVVLIWMWWRK